MNIKVVGYICNGLKLIKNRWCVFNPSKSATLGVFRGFRNVFLIETEWRGYKGLWDIVGNLLENHWFLDSFGSDLGGRKWDGTCQNFWAVGNFTFIDWSVIKKFLATGFHIKTLRNTRFYIWVNNILKEYNRNLTNLDLAGRGWKEIVICADGCCINWGEIGCGFWDWERCRGEVGGRMFTICLTILGSGVV